MSDQHKHRFHPTGAETIDEERGYVYQYACRCGDVEWRTQRPRGE